MDTKSPVKDRIVGHSAETTPSPTPLTSTVNLETPVKDAREAAPSVSSRPPGFISSEPEVVSIPSYSRWFSWNNIHECEARFLPDFFDSRSPSKNPRVYKYYRNSIVKKFRENPSRKITFTDVRKILIGDVGSIRRVFDFLEEWGLVNYAPSATKQTLKWEEKENKSGGASLQSVDPAVSPFDSSIPTRKCSGCESLCTIACYASDKQGLTLCSRCFVRGNFRVGSDSSDFRRVQINEDTKADWSDKETLHLLEALLHYGDDWKKVAEHVGGRSAKDCVNRFIKLPFGEEFFPYPDSEEFDNKFGSESIGTSPAKRMRLTPLSDASNPIMTQAAFLSALAGVEVAEAAARAAVTAVSEVDYKTSKESTKHQEVDVGLNELEGAHLEVKSLLEKEELDVERAVSDIIEVKMKEIQEKTDHFEEFEFQMERERQQLSQMKNLLIGDQLSLLFHNNSNKSKTGPGTMSMREEVVRID